MIMGAFEFENSQLEFLTCNLNTFKKNFTIKMRPFVSSLFLIWISRQSTLETESLDQINVKSSLVLR